MFRKQFYFIFSGLKIIGHRNPDSNIESLCISAHRLDNNMTQKYTMSLGEERKLCVMLLYVVRSVLLLLS
jgi:hypothetical protein